MQRYNKLIAALLGALAPFLIMFGVELTPEQATIISGIGAAILTYIAPANTP